MLRDLSCGKALQSSVLLCLFAIVGCQPSLTPEEGMQRAEAYRNEGKYTEAIIELKNALSDSPQHMDTRLMLSELYLLQRDGDNAANQLQKARELGLGEIDIRAASGRAFLLQKKYDRLLAEVNLQANDVAVLRADLLSLRGYAYFFKNDLQQAGQLFQQALGFDKNNLTALTGGAMVHLKNENYEQSSQQVEQALVIDAGYMDAWFIKGRLALIQKQYESAELAFGRAVDSATRGFTFLSPLQARIYQVRLLIDRGKMKQAGQAVEQLAADDAGQPVIHYLRALLAYESGNYDGAEEHIRVIRSKAPDYDPALLLEGAISYALDKLELANSALTTYLSHHPDSSAAQKLQTAVRVKLQHPKKAFDLDASLVSQAAIKADLPLLASSDMPGLGKSELSIPMIEKALLKDPQNVNLKMQLASARLSIGETDEAIRLLKTLPPTADKFGKREKLLLLAWSKKQSHKAALNFVDGYLEVYPEDSDALAHSGVILLRLGKPDAARERLEKALTLKPDSSQLLMMLTRLEYNEKNYAGAEELLARLLKMKPGNASVLFALANISATKGDKDKAVTWLERARQSSESAVEPRLMLVKYYLEQGNVSAAIEIILEATKIAPERADVWNAYSVVQNRSGDPTGAVDSLLKAEKLKPDSTTILMNLARSQLNTGDVVAAGDALRKLMKLAPDNFKVASMLAIIEMKQGNVKQAFAIALEQQSIAENRLYAMTLEGDLHMMAGEYDKAADVYQAVTMAAPSSALTAKLYSAFRKTAAAQPERILHDWLQKNPQDTNIRLLLASEYLTAGDSAKAMQEYETLTAQKPGDSDILNNLALTYHLLKSPKAVATAEKALSLKPDSAAIKDTLGWILVQEGNAKRGMPLLRGAASQLPENMEVKYHYAVALAESGDQSTARKILQKLVKTESGFATLEDAKKYLQTLDLQ